MGRFFVSWRQRSGVFVLAVACLVLGAWGRSQIFRDEISLAPQRFWYYEFVSSEGGLRLHRIDADPNGPGISADFWPLMYQSTTNRQYADSSPRLEEKMVWKWNVMGFAYGSGPSYLTALSVRIWAVPYWSILIPMTLLAAWLLLRKTQQHA